MLTGGNGAGHYIVIQEQPTEPRFGLNVGASLGGATHLRVVAARPLAWRCRDSSRGRNAAHMARILRQQPVRIAIHASRFVRA